MQQSCIYRGWPGESDQILSAPANGGREEEDILFLCAEKESHVRFGFAKYSNKAREAHLPNSRQSSR